MLARAYLNQKKLKLLYIGIMLIILLALVLVSIVVGSYKITFNEFIKSIFFQGRTNAELVIWQMRLPQTLTAALVGAGLALCGAVLQIVLKNPLASPFTLGISSSSAFGAALAIFFGSAYFSSPYMVSLSAFLFSLIATFIIVLLSRLKDVSNEAIILAGVATGSLFSAFLALLQYFSSDTQLSSIIFWMFGDCSRTTYKEILLILFFYLSSLLFFLNRQLDYKLLLFGDEQAKSFGVNVEKLRIVSMVIASLLSSVIVAFVGIIGFVGLAAPHIAKRITGLDYFLLSSTVVGSIILVASDLVAKSILHNAVLPVGIVTTFIGVPTFFYLIIRGKR